MKVTIPGGTVWWIGAIVLILTPASQNFAELNLENAVGIWLFDEIVGNEVIDSSGKENHGTFAKGAEPERIRRGKFDRALVFDGKDDSIDVPRSDSLKAIKKQISISVWVYPDGVQPVVRDGKTAISGGIMEKKDRSGWSLYSWESDLGAATLTWHLSLAGVWSNANGMVVGGILDEWQHIGCVYDGELVKFYLNGELKAHHPLDGEIRSFPDKLTIGLRSSGDHSGWFKGTMDDVAIFNTALDDDDIERLMNVGLGRTFDVMAVSPSDKVASVWARLKTR